MRDSREDVLAHLVERLALRDVLRRATQADGHAAVVEHDSVHDLERGTIRNRALGLLTHALPVAGVNAVEERLVRQPRR